MVLDLARVVILAMSASLGIVEVGRDDGLGAVEALERSLPTSTSHSSAVIDVLDAAGLLCSAIVFCLLVVCCANVLNVVEVVEAETVDANMQTLKG